MEVLDETQHVDWLLVLALGLFCLAGVIGLNYTLFHFCWSNPEPQSVEEERRKQRLTAEKRKHPSERGTTHPRSQPIASRVEACAPEARFTGTSNGLEKSEANKLEGKLPSKEDTIRNLGNTSLVSDRQHISSDMPPGTSPNMERSSGQRSDMGSTDPFGHDERKKDDIYRPYTGSLPVQDAYSSHVQNSYWQAPMNQQRRSNTLEQERPSPQWTTMTPRLSAPLSPSAIPPVMPSFPSQGFPSYVQDAHSLDYSRNKNETSVQPESVIHLQQDLLGKFKEENLALQRQLEYYQRIMKEQGAPGFVNPRQAVP